eukprot:9319656-Prorocentrum_lima.AAC.1
MTSSLVGSEMCIRDRVKALTLSELLLILTALTLSEQMLIEWPVGRNLTLVFKTPWLPRPVRLVLHLTDGMKFGKSLPWGHHTK